MKSKAGGRLAVSALVLATGILAGCDYLGDRSPTRLETPSQIASRTFRESTKPYVSKFFEKYLTQNGEEVSFTPDQRWQLRSQGKFFDVALSDDLAEPGQVYSNDVLWISK